MKTLKTRRWKDYKRHSLDLSRWPEPERSALVHDPSLAYRRDEEARKIRFETLLNWIEQHGLPSDEGDALERRMGMRWKQVKASMKGRPYTTHVVNEWMYDMLAEREEAVQEAFWTQRCRTTDEMMEAGQALMRWVALHGRSPRRLRSTRYVIEGEEQASQTLRDIKAALRNDQKRGSQGRWLTTIGPMLPRWREMAAEWGVPHLFEANGRRKFMPLERLREEARALGIQSGREYLDYRREHGRVDWPAEPSASYGEWTDWYDFLGKEKPTGEKHAAKKRQRISAIARQKERERLVGEVVAWAEEHGRAPSPWIPEDEEEKRVAAILKRIRSQVFVEQSQVWKKACERMIPKDGALVMESVEDAKAREWLAWVKEHGRLPRTIGDAVETKMYQRNRFRLDLRFAARVNEWTSKKWDEMK